MKALKRNAIPVWYALYLGEEDILDTNEHPTGERRARYGPLRKMMANVNAGFNGRYGINSQSAVEPFGVDRRYDKTLVVADMDCPMDEYSVLIIDRPVHYEHGQPVFDDGASVYDDDGQLVFDHIIIKVDKSINVLSYALKKVNVS